MSSTPSLTRRAFIGSAAAAGVASLSGCMYSGGGTNGGGTGGMPAGGQMATAINPEPYMSYFDRVVNAVEVGADPTGQESINPILNSYTTPGTLLVFPSGTYKMTGSHRVTGSGPVGIIGRNAILRHGEVTAVSGHTVTAGEYTGDTKMFSAGSSSSPRDGFLLFGGFIFDWSWHENAGMQGLNAHLTGESVIENIQFYGLHTLGTHGSLRVSTQSDDSVMMLRNIDMRWGGLHYIKTINSRSTDKKYGPDRPGPSWSTSGITITNTQAGTMWCENIACGAWPDNGLYLKGGEPDKGTVGRKIIRNCMVHNANVSGIRTNDGPAWSPHPWIDGSDGTPREGYERSTVENCYIQVDSNRDPKVFGNQLGIRLDDGAPVLRNSRVVLRKPNGNAIRVQSSASGARIENCRVDLWEPEGGIVMAGSGDVVNSVVNTIGFNSSGVVSGVSSGVDVRQLSPADIQAEQQRNQGNQTEQ